MKITTSSGSRTRKIYGGIIAGAIVLSGCQTVTKYQCNNKNWYEVGIRDGQSGVLSDAAFESHNSTCTAVGTTADSTSYQKGYDEGILGFCTTDSGESRAIDGFENERVCPARVSSLFDRGFNRGLELLCTGEGGWQLGAKGGIYRGTCPANKQKPFLQRYVAALEIVKSEAMTSQIIANASLTTVSASLASVKANITTYDSRIANAKKSGNKELETSLSGGRSTLVTEKNRLQRLEKKHRKEKESADEKISSTTELINKWRLELFR